MKIVKDISYFAPEGELTGTIISGELKVDHKNGKPRESVKLTIAVDTLPNDPMNDYRVRVDYWGPQANELLRDAQKVIGSEAYALTNMEGEIVPENLVLLEGRRVRFQVVHNFKPGFKEPYRKVVNLRSAA